ncbi:MAG: 50S ribosomal protein L25/general stress protein Ctc [Nitrospinota bacterium]
MGQLLLNARRREVGGKSAARRLRREGLRPGVVYGLREPVPLSFDPRELKEILNTEAGENVIFDLKLEGEDEAQRSVMVKEIQRDLISGDPLHVDFLEVRMDREVTVRVPVVLRGEAPGVKEGGVLSHHVWEVEIECLPRRIPSEVAVDVSGLEIGGTIHVRDLPLGDDIRVLANPDEVVATVSRVAAEVPAEAEAPAEAEEAPEEEAAPEAEGKEAPESSEG